LSGGSLLRLTKGRDGKRVFPGSASVIAVEMNKEHPLTLGCRLATVKGLGLEIPNPLICHSSGSGALFIEVAPFWKKEWQKSLLTTVPNEMTQRYAHLGAAQPGKPNHQRAAAVSAGDRHIHEQATSSTDQEAVVYWVLERTLSERISANDGRRTGGVE
jgi:hypothetical protein